MCTHTRNVANRWSARSNGLMLKHRDAHKSISCVLCNTMPHNPALFYFVYVCRIKIQTR